MPRTDRASGNTGCAGRTGAAAKRVSREVTIVLEGIQENQIAKD
jgi:hypothetical protein